MSARIEVPPGTVFGRLTVVREVGPGKDGNLRFECRCECGNVSVVRGVTLRKSHVTSCGCWGRSLRTTHGLSKSPEYHIWEAIITRCESKNNRQWKDYGGRGITICPEWRSDFTAFYRDMGPRPSKLHTIERNDNDGPYSSDNCCWQSRMAQSRNRRSNIWVQCNGTRKILTDACRDAGIKPSVALKRRKMGWPESDWFIPVDQRYVRGVKSKSGSELI